MTPHRPSARDATGAYGHAVYETVCVLFTGRAGSGKATIGQAVAEELRRRDRSCAVLDAAGVARHLTPGTDALIWCCTVLSSSGAVVIVTATVPSRAARELLRDAVPALLEVFLDAPASLCEQRSGVADDAFEEPYAPDLRVPTHDRDAAASVAQTISFLEEREVTPRDPPHPSERSS
jgi:adenylylsulfate kinase